MGPSFRQGTIQAIALAITVASSSVFSSFALAENINVILNQDLVVKLPPKVATIVIGNPLMANVTLLRGDLMVVTGKSYGATNIIMLDRTGTVLLERLIEVGSDPDEGTTYRGVQPDP